MSPEKRPPETPAEKADTALGIAMALEGALLAVVRCLAKQGLTSVAAEIAHEWAALEGYQADQPSRDDIDHALYETLRRIATKTDDLRNQGS